MKIIKFKHILIALIVLLWHKPATEQEDEFHFILWDARGKDIIKADPRIAEKNPFKDVTA